MLQRFTIIFLSFFLSSAALSAQATTRISVNSLGAQSREGGGSSVLSADGRIVAFDSFAGDLVAGDTNGDLDVFVHDTLTRVTTCVSVDSAGLQGDGDSYGCSLSADGRFVAFHSEAANLVAGDTNGAKDVFMHDRQTGQTIRLSVNSLGGQGNAFSEFPEISADGRFIAFSSGADNLVAGDVNGYLDVFLHDRQTGQCTLISKSSAGLQGNGSSYDAKLSADGQVIAFRSEASDLVAGDLNGATDVFILELATGATSRVSLTYLGAEANDGSWDHHISADGSCVGFTSPADNIVPGDNNGAPDAFVHDRTAATTVRISVDSQGAEVANGGSQIMLSADGILAAFASDSNQLVSPDLNGLNDVFLHDRLTGAVTLISATPAGATGNRNSIKPSISADGNRISFSSSSSDLVPSDTNRSGDVFLRNLDYAGPILARSGLCPGSVQLTITEAIPAGKVAILSGAPGTFVQPGAPCQGLVLTLAAPTLRVLRPADFHGTLVIAASMPSGACGLTVQAVDVTTCTASNAVIL